MEKDNCQFCHGAKGGVKGNENVYMTEGSTVTACDYCSVLVSAIVKEAVAIEVSHAETLFCERTGGHDWEDRPADIEEGGIFDVPYRRCRKCKTAMLVPVNSN